MKNKQCLHIHTTYADGNDSPEEIVLEAIERNFDSIGFSEHTFMAFSNFPYQMSIDDMPNYRNEINLLKEKYRDVIDIFCGLEYDMFSDVPIDGYDYLIGSIHYLDINGEKIGFDRGLTEVRNSINAHFDGDGLKFAKKYFETVSLLYKKQKFDIIGHFDIITKNNEMGNFIDTNSYEYLSYGYNAIHNLKGKIPLFEVNTGAIARGYRTTPYPQMEFLKEFQKCDFGAIITSDCHSKNLIDCYFDEAKELLKKAGFNTHWVLTNNGFKEVRL